ncbi:Permease of the major facilitator superfamily [Candidatus Glomeribacter gigasporarum BEG34]|uniref:Permease of the major facilitator superfamily n=1 Tax=Candidatus Glomeribacter gigasporarum BEG34 TaxID=1070319 RepID=G2J7S3_9BURK|nr:multidrug effflux MFS transporter [Candidatus Glomeribacter gigasporarum]CCD28818.1 Permease of the major facilitator superfamily [Candidatus Glomeribacter gigasporarum BEG34]
MDKPKYLPWVFVLALMSACMEVDVSVPSFPDIARYFSASEGRVQLSIAYNFLGFCLGACVWGPLSEAYGRRKMMLLGNAILLLGAWACFFAPSLDFLLAARFIQGIGASTSAVLVFAMIADRYQGAENIRLVGFMNACLSLLMAIAPILGGFMNAWVGWRGNYGSVALLSLIAWIGLFTLLPETKRQRVPVSIRKISRDYRALLQAPVFINTGLAPSLLFSAYMAFIATSSFLYQETWNLSIMDFVRHQTVIVGSFACVSLFSVKLMQWIGNKQRALKFSIALCVLSTLSLMLFALKQVETPILTTSLMSLFCMGFALCYPILFSASLDIFPELRGTASSLIMSTRALLMATFTGLTGHFYNGTLLTVTFSLALGTFLALACVACYLRLDSRLPLSAPAQ